MKNTKLVTALKAAFPHTIPIFAGYLVLGFGFGLLLESKGYHAGWALLMSLIIFAGSGQYVAVDLLAGGASLISSALMTLLINARHLFYGLSLLVRYRDMKKVKPYLIFGLTDETYSLVSGITCPKNVDEPLFFFSITFLNHLYWIFGSVLGALFGQALPIDTAGVDFSMTSLFLVIATNNLLDKSRRIPTLIGIGCAFVCLLLFGPDKFLIPTMAAIMLALICLRPILDKSPEQALQKEAEHEHHA